MSDPRRQVPRTDAVLADPRLAAAVDRLGRDIVKAAVLSAQDAVRRGDVAPDAVADLAVSALPPRLTALRPVLNATGVVVHTNLGRAPLSPAAVEALQVAAGYVDVEYDVDSGERSQRGRSALGALAAAVPDAEAVHVVNNGAAALVLAATALAAAREIVVSRGELVEIGDGFRLPDLLVSTGARLREVGTTNRTTLRDYADAIGPQTGFVLKVHPSNFVVRGFTSGVGVAELSTLAAPVVADIGSGLLRPESMLPDEPDATSALRAGAALVTASGDKLLGGPQAGLLLGQRGIVERLRRHPLARALRVDKLTLAALEATLRGPDSPVSAALHADADDLRGRAERIVDELAAAGVDVVLAGSVGLVGGGGAPGVELPGWAVSLPASYAGDLRRGEPCIVGRVERDRCLLDLRCVPADRDGDVVKAVLAV
ncbi:MAG TPA: L-seryl-tRNA(Sec) selenium transferase [Mycobacteriales bacterium]|nr:L-seryl-tRNA(Sec) selenium transferase [Mycobacteriales bacterium]